MLQTADFISCEIRRKTYSAVSNFYARAAKALEMVVSHVGRKKKKDRSAKGAGEPRDSTTQKMLIKMNTLKVKSIF